jgi:DNA-binding HxlR family transcriptional regulator
VPLPADRENWTPDPLNADCPSRAVLDLIADKWAVLVIAAIGQGHHRNGELLRRIEGISQKALTRTLRGLELDGLVHRHDFAEVPPRVEYTFTTTGASLQPLLTALCTWAVEHLDEVTAARGAVRTIARVEPSAPGRPRSGLPTTHPTGRLRA